MAKPGAVVDVVGAQDHPRELLQEVVVFVEALGRAVDGQGIRPVGVTNVGQSPGREVQRLVPGGPPPLARAALAGADERMREAVVALRVVPAEAALDAEPTLVDWMVVRRHGVGNLTAAHVDFQPAAHAAEGSRWSGRRGRP